MLKVEGIVIDPDPECRTRLRQACFAVPVLAKIETCGDLDEVLRRLGVSGDLDYTAIFISARFDKNKITDFVTQAKQTERGQDSAFVLVLTADHQDGQVVTDGLQQGADGFLFEPFSVESLTKTATLAMEIKNKRRELRETASVTLLIKDALNNLDIVAERIVRNQEGGPEYKYFRDLSTDITELNDRMRSIYIKQLPTIIDQQPAPLLNIEQEVKMLKSAKMRAHMRLMQKMRQRGQNIDPLENSETLTQQKLWEENTAIQGRTTIIMNIDLYDQPTSNALYEFLYTQSEQKKCHYEIDLNKSRALSSYALAKLIEADKILQQHNCQMTIKNLRKFPDEVFKTLKLREFLKLE